MMKSGGRGGGERNLFGNTIPQSRRNTIHPVNSLPQLLPAGVEVGDLSCFIASRSDILFLPHKYEEYLLTRALHSST